MKINVLGTGSNGNCYVLQIGIDILIIEAGIRINKVKRAINYRIEDVNGVLVSHIHGDHSQNMHIYEHSFQNCYAPREVIDKKQLKRTAELKNKKEIKLGNFIVKPILVEHDCIENFAFYIYHKDMGGLLYITDTAKFPMHVQGIDYLMIEANYSDIDLRENIFRGITPAGLAKRVKNSHMSIEEALRVIIRHHKAKPLNNVLLIHMSDKNINDVAAKEDIEKITGIPTDIAVKNRVYKY